MEFHTWPARGDEERTEVTRFNGEDFAVAARAVNNDALDAEIEDTELYVLFDGYFEKMVGDAVHSESGNIIALVSIDWVEQGVPWDFCEPESVGVYLGHLGEITVNNRVVTAPLKGGE
jgi:hypothetical protein